MRFTFNKKARAVAISAIRKIEGGSMASAVLGSFSANPQVTALSSAVLFVVCRAVETVLAGIEDDVPKSRPRRRKAAQVDQPEVGAKDKAPLDSG